MLSSSDGDLYRTIYGILEGSTLGVSLGSTDVETIGSDEGIIDKLVDINTTALV